MDVQGFEESRGFASLYRQRLGALHILHKGNGRTEVTQPAEVPATNPPPAPLPTPDQPRPPTIVHPPQPTRDDTGLAALHQTVAALPERIVDAIREGSATAAPPAAPATPVDTTTSAVQQSTPDAAKPRGLAGWWFGAGKG